MISKEKFVKYMKFIESLRNKEKSFNEGLTSCFGEQNAANIYVYAEVENQMIEMLCDMMDIEYNVSDEYGDDIQYFINERNFGKKPGSDKCISEIIDDEEIFYDISSSEKLYDYIVETKNK